MSEHEPINSELEQRLRVGLAAAADLAPTFTGLRTPAPSVQRSGPTGSHRSRGLLRSALAVAAALIVIAGAGGVAWWARDTNRGGTGGGSGSCAAVLRWHQRTYTAVGQLARFPRPGSRLGNGTIPGCDDGGGPEPGESVALSKLPGFPPTVAVMALDNVWLVHGQDLPAKIRALRAPVTCTGGGTSGVSGTVMDMHTRARSDFHPTLPYTLRVRVDAGPAEIMGRYASVLVVVRVNESTDGGKDADLLRAALEDGARVTVATRCARGHFMAQGIRQAR